MASNVGKTSRHARATLMLSVLLAYAPTEMARQSSEALPKVIHHAEPRYPPLAAQTRIDGDVRVRFVTDGESVTDVVVESGHPLLRPAAEENVRTWKFTSHTPGTFDVTFRYKFSSGGTEVTFLESPSIVQIETTPMLISDGCQVGLDLGIWKTRLNSAHGKTSRVLRLSSYCESLEGNAVGPKGKREEIDFGHKEGDFLAFTINLRQPDGQHMKTFFVGKMSKYKIVGTFVDSAGVTGEWTAVRMAEPPTS
jgi:TonB family protein